MSELPELIGTEREIASGIYARKMIMESVLEQILNEAIPQDDPDAFFDKEEKRLYDLMSSVLVAKSWTTDSNQMQFRWWESNIPPFPEKEKDREYARYLVRMAVQDEADLARYTIYFNAERRRAFSHIMNGFAREDQKQIEEPAGYAERVERLFSYQKSADSQEYTLLIEEVLALVSQGYYAEYAERFVARTFFEVFNKSHKSLVVYSFMKVIPRWMETVEMVEKFWEMGFEAYLHEYRGDPNPLIPAVEWSYSSINGATHKGDDLPATVHAHPALAKLFYEEARQQGEKFCQEIISLAQR